MASDYIREGSRAIKQNRWDNWYGYQGGRRTMAFGSDEQAARSWLLVNPASHPGVTVPVVHLNGTSVTDLLAQYRAAATALQVAIDAVIAAAPHARDYYPVGTWPQAQEEFDRRLGQLRAIRTDVEMIVHAVLDIKDE